MNRYEDEGGEVDWGSWLEGGTCHNGKPGHGCGEVGRGGVLKRKKWGNTSRAGVKLFLAFPFGWWGKDGRWRGGGPFCLPRPLPCPFLPLPLPLSSPCLYLCLWQCLGREDCSLEYPSRGMGQWLGQVWSLEQGT